MKKTLTDLDVILGIGYKGFLYFGSMEAEI